MRRLAIDPGDKRIGLACSDEDGRIATPVETVDATSRRRAVERIAEVARALDAKEIVVGLPLGLDGREGPATRKARELAGLVEDATGLRIVLFDERLTTAQAERSLREAGVRAKDQRKVVDQAAATLLLQSYLDAQRAREGDESWDEGPVLPVPDRDPGRASRRRRGR